MHCFALRFLVEFSAKRKNDLPWPCILTEKSWNDFCPVTAGVRLEKISFSARREEKRGNLLGAVN